MAETPEDPWAGSPATDEPAHADSVPVSPEQARAAAEGVAHDVTHALGQVASELGGVAQTVLDATAKVYEHDVFHDLGEADARSGMPDRHFEVAIPRDDRAAYETGRHDAFKVELDPNDMPTTPQTSMKSITKEEEEASKRYTEEKEATERYLHLKDEWDEELKHTSREDIEPKPIEPIPRI